MPFTEKVYEITSGYFSQSQHPSLKVIWDVADTLNGLMAIPNLIALAALSGMVVKLMRRFLAGKPYASQTGMPLRY